MAVLTVNELETARFGIVCARLVLADTSPDMAAIEADARAQGVAMISVRVGADDLAQVRWLEEVGFRLMDTLVYYGRSLEDLPDSPPLPAHLHLRPATAADAPAIEHLTREAFSGYLGHYHSDPRLDDTAATEAYADWATRCLTKASGTNVMVALLDSQIAGYIAHERTAASEIDVFLNAVCPKKQRRGIYTALFNATLRDVQRRNAARLIISTQINNYAVQKVWSRLGLTHERSYYTLHKWMDVPS